MNQRNKKILNWLISAMYLTLFNYYPSMYIISSQQSQCLLSYMFEVTYKPSSKGSIPTVWNHCTHITNTQATVQRLAVQLYFFYHVAK